MDRKRKSNKSVTTTPIVTVTAAGAGTLESPIHDVILDDEDNDLNIEDNWKRRLQIVESLYDSHVTKLQKDLLSEKRYSRLFESIKNYNSRLKDQVQEYTLKNSKLQNKLNSLETVLEKRERDERKLREQLEKFKISEQSLAKELRNKIRENQDIKYKTGRYNNNLYSLKVNSKKLEEQLNEVELERKDLKDQLSERERKILDLNYQVQKIEEKHGAALLDQQEPFPKGKKLQMLDKISGQTDEEKLLKLKHEIESLVGQLKNETNLKRDVTRKKNLLHKNLLSTQVDLDRVSNKLQNKEIETLHWKQEFDAMEKFRKEQIQGLPNNSTSANVRRKDQQLQSSIQDKQLTDRMNTLESKIKKLDSERELLLNSMRSLECLQRNQIKLHQSILDHRTKLITTHSNIFQSIQPTKNIRKRNLETGSHTIPSFPQKSLPKLTSYVKKIQNLEKELINYKNKYNSLYVKLKDRNKLRTELNLTQKALFNVEKEKVIAENYFDGILQRLFATGTDKADSIGTKLLKQRILSNLDVIEDLRKEQNQQPQIPEEELLNIEYELDERPKVSKTIENSDEELRKLRADMTLLERRQAVFNAICMKNEEAQQQQQARQRRKELQLMGRETIDMDFEEGDNDNEVHAKQRSGSGDGPADDIFLPIDKLLGQIGIDDEESTEEEGEESSEASKKSSKSSSSSSSIGMHK